MDATFSVRPPAPFDPSSLLPGSAIRAPADYYPHGPYDVIIIGAGVAGAPLAKVLGQQGLRVCLVERNYNEPNRIVGEILQPRGVYCLHKLGMYDCLDSIESPEIYGYGVFNKDTGASFNQPDRVRLTYPNSSLTPPSLNENAKTIGRGFHHGRFVQSLRTYTKLNTTSVDFIEATAREYISRDGKVVGVKISRTVEGGRPVDIELTAPLTIVCDGCNSGMRHNKTSISHTSKFFGLILKTSASDLPYRQHGHVVLGHPSPILSYPISASEVRYLIDIPETTIAALKEKEGKFNVVKYLESHIAPQLPTATLQKAFVEAVHETVADGGGIPSMPNSKLHPEPIMCPGVIFLGDSHNMRHPLTGGGMSVALNDVLIITSMMKGRKTSEFASKEAMAKWMPIFYKERFNVACSINVLAAALYALFSAPNKDMMALRRGCFAYFLLGGIQTRHPMGLLSGVLPRPYYLIYHFFAVAIYAFYHMVFKTRPFQFRNVTSAISALTSSAKLMLPLLWKEHFFDPRYPQIKEMTPEQLIRSQQMYTNSAPMP